MSKASSGYSHSKRGKSIRSLGNINTEGASKILERNNNDHNDKANAIGNRTEPINLLIAHDNRKDWHTTKSHNVAEELDKDPQLNVIYDKQYWNHGERTSPSQTDEREKEMVQKTDVIIRIVPPSSITGTRNEGAQREIRKGINAGKPVIEVYERGARDTPNRSIQERNYNKLVKIHLKSGEHLKSGIKRGLEELKRKNIID